MSGKFAKRWKVVGRKLSRRGQRGVHHHEARVQIRVLCQRADSDGATPVLHHSHALVDVELLD